MFLFAPKWKGKVNPMESSNQFLGTERIGKLMQKYAIPCIISLLVGALYNIVDQIFIANASYLGSYGNAANTVVFPLTVVALAIAVMIGDGCCAFVSISLGQNEVPKARRSVGNAVVMCLVSSIVLAALYLIFADAILAMFGGTVNAETVVLLSKLKVNHHIEIELKMDELDLTSAESKATYDEIKTYVLEKYGLKVSQLYIAQVKRKCGIIERKNYNVSKKENAKVPQCPPEKEAAIMDALKHFQMI